MNQQNALAPRSNNNRIDAIEGRINHQVAGGVGVNPTRGLVVQSLDQAMELAKLMSVSDMAVPKHLRGNPGACLAIAIQGFEWSVNPFALANKSYCVNDRLAYESALYHAVIQRRAPIKGRIKSEYSGKDLTRSCRVWAMLDDGSGDKVEYTSPTFAQITTKNSPLWKGDPDQQLFYYSVRAFARKHFPDVMMGIYTVDELSDNPTIVEGAPKPANTSLAHRLTDRPVSESQSFVPDDGAEQAMAAQDAAQGEIIDTQTGEVSEPDTSGAEAEPPQDLPPSLGTHDALVSAMNEAAMDLQLAPSAVGAWWAEYALKNALKGKEARMTPAARAVALEAFKAAHGGK